MGEKCFEVGKKIFKVKFEGIHRRPWILVTERFQGKTFWWFLKKRKSFG